MEKFRYLGPELWKNIGLSQRTMEKSRYFDVCEPVFDMYYGKKQVKPF